MKSSIIISTLGLLVFFISTDSVKSHGSLILPVSRNAVSNDDYCPHCLSAGGPSVQEAAGLKWPESSVSASCGDDPLAADQPHAAGGKYSTTPKDLITTWEKGSNVEIQLSITTYHGGANQFRICTVPTDSNEGSALTDGCLNEHILVQADVPGAQDPGNKYFFFPKDADEATCCWPNRVFTLWYQLPDNLACDGMSTRCVLQWRWTTAHTCHPPFMPEEYRRVENTCGQASARYPEEFFNCADVVIKSGVEEDPTLVQAFDDSRRHKDD